MKSSAAISRAVLLPLRLSIPLAVAIAFLGVSTDAWAELVGRSLDNDPLTPEAYFDTVLGITWLGDANYARTSGLDSDGTLELPSAHQRVGGLQFAGEWGSASDWRLPFNGPINGVQYNYSYNSDGSTDHGFNISAIGSAYAGSTASELAHLYYNTLANPSACPPGECFDLNVVVLSNTGPFTNLRHSSWYGAGRYWSAGPSPFPGDFPMFNMNTGYQTSAGGTANVWPVHNGDVGAPLVVTPIPAAGWLLLSGLGWLGMLGRGSRDS